MNRTKAFTLVLLSVAMMQCTIMYSNDSRWLSVIESSDSEEEDFEFHIEHAVQGYLEPDQFLDQTAFNMQISADECLCQLLQVVVQVMQQAVQRPLVMIDRIMHDKME